LDICESPIQINRNQVVIPHVKDCNLNHIFKQRGLDIVYSVLKKLNCIIKKDRDKLEDIKQTGMVYEINYNDCHACYIGQTNRHFITRIKEHE